MFFSPLISFFFHLFPFPSPAFCLPFLFPFCPLKSGWGTCPLCPPPLNTPLGGGIWPIVIKQIKKNYIHTCQTIREFFFYYKTCYTERIGGLRLKRKCLLKTYIYYWHAREWNSSGLKVFNNHPNLTLGKTFIKHWWSWQPPNPLEVHATLKIYIYPL